MTTQYVLRDCFNSEISVMKMNGLKWGQTRSMTNAPTSTMRLVVSGEKPSDTADVPLLVPFRAFKKETSV